MSSKYFFIDLPNNAMTAILTHCVSKSLKTQAKLWDGSYLVKLEGDIPPVLSSFTPYTHSEMKIEKATREQGRSEIS